MAERWTSDRLDPACYPGPGLDLPVIYGNLDTNAHLNNVELGRFFEHSRATAFAGTGFWHAVHAEGGMSVVVRVAIDYLREVRLGAVLHVRSRMAHVGSSSATVEQGAWVDGVCIGLAECVFAHSREGSSAPWPEEARVVLQTMSTAS